MSNAPISRDAQIELMKTAEARLKSNFSQWVADESVVSVLSLRSNDSEDGGSFAQNDVMVSACG